MTETRAPYLGRLPLCPICSEPGTPHHPDLCLRVLSLKRALRLAQEDVEKWQAAYDAMWQQVAVKVERVLKMQECKSE